MDLKHKAAEELAKMGAWSQDSLGYAREHGQRQLVWLLETVRGEVELEDALLALPSGEHLRRPARGSVWRKPMHKGQRVADMAPAALRRRARAAAERTGEPFEEALKAILETEAGLQLRDLSDGPHRDESAELWQEDNGTQTCSGARTGTFGEGKMGATGSRLGKLRGRGASRAGAAQGRPARRLAR